MVGRELGEQITRAQRFSRVLAVVLAAALALSVLLAFEDRAFGAISLTVNTTSDAIDTNPGDGRCDANSSRAGNQCTLRAAIQETNATAGRDTIDLPPGIYKFANLGASDLDGGDAGVGDLDILDSLDIRGASRSSTIIDGNRDALEDVRVLQIGLDGSGLTPSVDIRDVTITNGEITGGGPGGIEIQQGSSLVLSRVVVSENRSTSQGAGIRNNGTLVLRESTVDNNQMTGGGVTGGGLQASGGGILNFGHLVIERSTISHNLAARGGGIYTEGGIVEISNSTISGNSVYGGGGGIVNGFGTLYITASTITNNEANRAGSDEQKFRRGGGGIQNIGTEEDPGVVRIGGTILAKNTQNLEGISDPDIPYSPDCYSTSPNTSYSYRDNIVGFRNDQCDMVDVVEGISIACGDFDFCSEDPRNHFDPKLESLGNDGGPTLTHKPLSDSLAIDTDVLDTGLGETFFDCRSTDQRGGPRPQDGVGSGTAKCDIGALEVGAPVVDPPSGFFSNLTLGTSTVPISIGWNPGFSSGPVARYELHQSTDSGTFASVTLPSATTTSITRSLQPGHSYRFRVRAQDQAGKWSEWAVGPLFRLNAFQETSSAVTYPSGTWTTSALSGAYGGSVRHAKASGARARLTFTGSGVAWVSTKGPNRGKAEVWLDGIKQPGPVDLYSATTQTRRMVFDEFHFDRFGSSHTLEVRVLGTKNTRSTDTRVDVDAFVVLR